MGRKTAPCVVQRTAEPGQIVGIAGASAAALFSLFLCAISEI